MSLSLEDVSLVYWFPDRDKHRCGYCKQENSAYSNGMWADSLTVDDYQDILDRGWRRSGKYCYKPIMKETCCPQYTIRCDTTAFKLSKSQKKVIKKYNKWMINGVLKEPGKSIESGEQDGESHITYRGRPDYLNDYKQIDKKLKIEMKSGDGKDSVDGMEACCSTNKDRINKDGINKDSINKDSINKDCINKDYSNQGDFNQDLVNDVLNSKKIDGGSKISFKKGVGPDPKKPLRQKAKVLRLEKRRKKLEAQGLPLDDDSMGSRDGSKGLFEFLEAIGDNPKQKLEIKLVQMHNKEETFNLSARLFEKYQIIVHNEKPEDADVEQFQEFLVDTPLKAKQSEIPGITYGSYHQQYWINDKLIAVGVIDILPRCVSSVYFFYDPDYRCLTLGTYGSLREVEFTQQLNKKLPNLQYYYMGFYIHSCSKMRYKGKLNPSDLLCPETYCWFPINQCIPKLELAKYSRLNDDLTAKDEGNCTKNDIESIKILMGCQYTTFRHYRYKSRDLLMYQTIGKLIGRKCINRFMIIQQGS